ncbi:MAG TPA: Rieske 2Fe-2S domain-containing protein [Acidimicrobiales bacterium]|nr:Rieske 2Fe-2S domain-containing protein [Acidimicrobiales bacterium]
MSDVLFDGRRVHRRAYVDPQVFELEMDRIFAGTWVYLAHESQIPEPNDYVVVEIGRRSVIVTRRPDGNVAALLNRCTHRGVQLCVEQAGSAKRFTCAYHGWTFANDGTCVAVPFPRPYGETLDKSAYDLGRFPRVEIRHGFIFGSLTPEVPTLDEHLGAAADLLGEWTARSPSGRVVVGSGARRIQIAGNWKLCWDNAADGYHAGFVHKSLVVMTNERHGGGKSLSHFDRDPDAGAMYTADLGRGHAFLDQRPAVAPDRWAHARPVPAAEEIVDALRREVGDDQLAAHLDLVPGAAMNISIFPNLFLSGNLLATLEPVSVGLSNMTSWATTYDGVPDAVNQLRLRFSEDFVNFGEPDDIEVWERTQRALSIGEVQWLDVSRGSGLDGDADERGVRRVPITYETSLRSYLAEWARLLDLEGAR